MTIAVGFLCDGGKEVYIAADRQFTSPGFFKYQEKKYFTDQKGALGLAFAFAGDPGVFREVQQKVCGYLDQVEDLSVTLVQATIEEVVNSLNLRFSGSLYMLVGVNEIFDPPKLIIFDGKGVFLAEDRVYAVGCGESSLLRYLGDHLYAPDLPSVNSLGLAAYLVKKATQYVDYCGEPIDILHGDVCGFVEVEPEKIKAAIQMMERQEQFLSTLLIQKPFEI
ncbi:MAG TPA: hypothetical protein VGR47_08810 [Terracidiphilus sp.]|nr:hypothetical protein [Terracidiphilus sp.]